MIDILGDSHWKHNTVSVYIVSGCVRVAIFLFTPHVSILLAHQFFIRIIPIPACVCFEFRGGVETTFFMINKKHLSSFKRC